MKIDFIRNFIKLYQKKNFSELAKELNISQSTLSHQISQIEKEIGDITLINRTTRTFELTDEGKIFLEHAKKIIELYDSSLRKINIYRENKIGEVEIKITASTLPGSHILPKYIANFRNENQGVQFKILINNSLKSINLLLTNEADFAAIGSFMGYNSEDFDYVKIGEEELVFICSPHHDLLKRGKASFSFNEILQYPLVSREKGSGTLNVIKAQFAPYDQLKINLEINDNDSIISAVSESNNLAIMSETIALKAQDAGLIKIIDVKEYPTIAKREIFLIKQKGQKMGKLKQKFWDYLES